MDNFFTWILMISLWCFSSLASSSFPVQTEYYIHDAYRYGFPNSISTLSKQWKLNRVLNSIQDKTTICGNFSRMLGGFNMSKAGDIMERTYNLTASHGVIFYYLSFFLIDGWQPADVVEILIDNQITFSFEPYQILAKLGTTLRSQCGDSNLGDIEISIVGAVFHSAANITFTIRSNPLNSQAFYGILDLKMLLRESKQTDTQFSYIKTSYTALQTLPNVNLCSNKFYAEINNPSSCKPCHSSCAECTGPSTSDCIACANYYAYDVDLNSCVACSSNCLLCQNSQPNQCELCVPNKMLYWNSTCRSSCNSPYVKDEFNLYCMTPCQANATYMSPNNICLDSCSAPLVARVEGKAKFCDSPCSVSKNEYLYWNGSCQPSCPFYPRTTNGIRFCDACPPGNYLYPNTTCLSNCSDPFKQGKQGESLLCHYPCGNSNRFYNEEDKTCKQTCEYPYEIQDNVFCVLKIQEAQAAQIKSVAGTLNTAESTTNSVGTSIGFLDLGNPASIFVNAYIDMFKKIKYITIKYPPKLQYFFQTKIDQKFITMPEQLKALFTNHPLPEKFKQYRIHSSFFVNFFQEIVVLFLIGVIVLLCYWAKNYKYLQFFCKVFKWNLSITLFTSYFGEMVLFTSLEVMTADLTMILSIISYIFCFFINLLAFIALIKIISVISGHWFFQIKQKIPNKFPQYNQSTLTNFEIVFKSLKTKSLIQQAFMLLFVLRVYMFSIIIGYFHEYPFLQTIVITILSSSMLFYFIIIRPFKTRVDFCQFLVQELVTLVVMASTLTLSVFDKYNIENIDGRETLGEVILYCNMAYSVVGMIFSLIRVVLVVKKVLWIIIKSYREKKSLKQKQEKKAGAVEGNSLNSLQATNMVVFKPLDRGRLPNKQTQALDIKNRSNSSFSHIEIETLEKSQNINNLC